MRWCCKLVDAEVVVVGVTAGRHFAGDDMDIGLRGHHRLQVNSTTEHNTSRPRRRMTHVDSAATTCDHTVQD